MSADTVVEIIRQALATALWLSAPLLLVGFIAGIIISLFQVLTSMQDSAFSSVPRLAVFIGAFILAMPWMLKKILAYTVQLFGDFSRYAR